MAAAPVGRAAQPQPAAPAQLAMFHRPVTRSPGSSHRGTPVPAPRQAVPPLWPCCILTGKKILVQTSPERKSNVVHTVTLKDAIMKCILPEVKPCVYSVVNHPQWTWKDVFEYYNYKKTQIEFKPSTLKSRNANGFFWKILKSNKKFIIPLLYFAPNRFELYIQRKLSMKRMMVAISSIQGEETVYSSEELSYEPIPVPFLPGLAETRELLKKYSLKVFDTISEKS